MNKQFNLDFTSVNNKFLKDDNLTYEEKGLISIICYFKQYNKNITIESLSEYSKENIQYIAIITGNLLLKGYDILSEEIK